MEFIFHDKSIWNNIGVVYYPQKTFSIFQKTHLKTQRSTKQQGIYGCSQNAGTPKSSILIGFSIINHPSWGTTILGKNHIYIYIYTDKLGSQQRVIFFRPKTRDEKIGGSMLRHMVPLDIPKLMVLSWLRRHRNHPSWGNQPVTRNGPHMEKIFGYPVGPRKCMKPKSSQGISCSQKIVSFFVCVFFLFKHENQKMKQLWPPLLQRKGCFSASFWVPPMFFKLRAVHFLGCSFGYILVVTEICSIRLGSFVDQTVKYPNVSRKSDW